MSWTSYTDALVTSKVELCGIAGKDGNAWAQVAEFPCAPDEVKALINGVADSGPIACNGACLGGKKWTMIRTEPTEDIMLLKGKGDDSKLTLVVALGGTCVVYGANKDGAVTAEQVRKAVGDTRDYLKNAGY